MASMTEPKLISGNSNQTAGIRELRIFLNGTNLRSPISTFDYKEDAISRYNTYPLLRSVSLGLNVRI